MTKKYTVTPEKRREYNRKAYQTKKAMFESIDALTRENEELRETIRTQEEELRRLRETEKSHQALLAVINAKEV